MTTVARTAVGADESISEFFDAGVFKDVLSCIC